jgi:Glycosyltransferase sugar-binding region containing DXD motif
MLQPVPQRRNFLHYFTAILFFLFASYQFYFICQLLYGATILVDDAVIDMPYEPPPKIPHRMIFTAKENLLETKEPRHLYENVIHTINVYRDAWKETNATVWFLNDTECREYIAEADPMLLPIFDGEQDGSYKADICRVAVLYLHGGYYFDIDMKSLTPVLLNATTTFATVLSGVNDFFQSFLAAAPRHVVLKASFETIKAWYQHPDPHSIMGTRTLSQAYNSTSPDERGPSYIMIETNLDHPTRPFPDYRRQQGGKGNCNFAVADKEETVLYFFSRIVGSKGCLKVPPMS